MANFRSIFLTSALLLVVLIVGIPGQIEAKVLTHCEAAKQLQVAGVSRTFLSNWVCLMQNESGMNTRLVTGPGAYASCSYGIFQINSYKGCTRGRKGGICNKRCQDFIDDDITDDIACAVKIHELEGFKYWEGWMKKCKNHTLPNVSQCKRRR